MKSFCGRHIVTLDLSLSLVEIWMQQLCKKSNMICIAEKEGATIVESEEYERYPNLYDSTMTNLNAEDNSYFLKAIMHV